MTALLFISHAAVDSEIVSRVAAFVSADRPQQVFASSQPGLGTTAGEQWEEDLYTRLRRSAAVLFVLTPASLASQWCFAELAMAKASGIPILTLRAADDVPTHPLTRDVQSLDLTDESAWPTLDAWLRRHVPEVVGTWPEGSNPFPGAAAFTADMEAVFVGREDDVTDILEVFAPLRSESGSRRIVSISGPSGSGKSSFVQAGIVPRLTRRPGWRVLPTVRPGEDPFGGLAIAVAAVSGEAAADVRARLMDGDLEVINALTVDAAGGPTQTVVFFDQFEEIATLAGDRDQQGFLDLLERLARGQAPVWVLLTVRSEFITSPDRGAIAGFVGGRALNHLLLPLATDGALIRRIVREPAVLAGADVSEDMLDRIVADVTVGDRTGASLPLIAFALRQTWDQMGRRHPALIGRELTLDDYLATGGVREVITRQATAAQRRLALRGLDALILPTMARFVVPSLTGEPVLRRRLPEATLTEEMRAVVGEFQEHRLLRVIDTAGRLEYEVTHEALITAWPELNKYVAEHQAHLQDVAEAERRAHAWERGGRDPADLLRGALLHRLLSEPSLLTDPVTAGYLAASVDADKETKRSLVRDSAARQAEAALADLPTRPIAARERVLAALAECRAAGTDPPGALGNALYRVLSEVRELSSVRAHSAAVRAVALSQAGDLIVTGGDDGVVRLWRPGEDEPYRTMDGYGCGIEAIAISEDGRSIAVTGSDGRLSVHRDDGAVLGRDLGFVAYSVTFVPGSPLIAAAGEDGLTVLVSSEEGLPEAASTVAHPSYAVACGAAPDGERLYTAGADGDIASWRLPSLELERRVHGHDEPVTSLSIGPAGEFLVSAGLDGMLRIWRGDLATRTSVMWSRSRLSFITATAFSGTGNAIVTGTSDGVISQIDLDGNRAEADLTGHGGPVTAVAVGGSPASVFSGGADRTIRRWRYDGRRLADAISDVNDTVEAIAFADDRVFLAAHENVVGAFTVSGSRVGRPWAGHADRVWDVAVARDRRLIVTSGGDGALYFWNPDGTPQRDPITVDGAAMLTAARFDASGELLVTGGSDGAVRVWRRADGFAETIVGYHEGQANKVEFLQTPGELLIVSAGDDGELRVFGLDGSQRANRRMSGATVKALAVAEGWIYVQGEGGVLHALDLDLKDRREPVHAHEGRVTEIVTHPVVPVCTVGSDGYLRRWTRDLRVQADPVRADQGGVWSLAVSPDGRAIVTGANSSVAIWRGGDWKTWSADLGA